MDIRDAQFYDLIARGLGAGDYQTFFDDYLAQKYNRLNISGVDWDPDIQIDFSFTQLEADFDIYTMPTYVDVDSPGVYKSTQGFELSTGKIPRMRHGYAINEKILREEMAIFQKTGSFSTDLSTRMRDLLFDHSDKLIGGGRNAFTYQRDQMVSKREFQITLENNPGGIKGITLGTNKYPENKTVLTGNKRWFTNLSSDGTLPDNLTPGSESDPIKDLKDRVRKLKNMGIINCQYEVEYDTFQITIQHPKVRTAVVLSMYPLTQNSNVESIAANLTDEAVKSGLERLIGCPIVVNEDVVAVEKFDKQSGKVERKQIKAFEPNVWVLMPVGNIGNIKSVMPIVVDPNARVATFDGGRSILKQWFNAETNTQYIEYECTALVVLDKVKYMLYLTIG